MKDLDAAIQFTMETESHSSAASSIDNATHSGNLGILLSKRFEVTGDFHDLDKAIDLINGALELLPSGHASRSFLLGRLGSQFGKKFEATGAMDTLNRAIELAEEAVTVYSGDSLILASQLENESVLRARRFEVTGNIDDLIRAIDLSAEPSMQHRIEHPQRADRLANLRLDWEIDSSELETRRISIKPLGVAISAVDATPVLHDARASRIGTSGSST